MRVNCSKEMQWAQGSSGTAYMEVNLFLAVGRAVKWSLEPGSGELSCVTSPGSRPGPAGFAEVVWAPLVQAG